MTKQTNAQTEGATPVSAAALERVVWHCGWQKTGTTSIQLMLRKNAPALAQQVTVFPKTRITRPLGNAIKAHFSTGAPDIATLERLAAEMIAEIAAQSGPVALISDENLVGWQVYENGRTLVDFAAEILPILARVAAPAQSQFIFYTREMEPWLKSAHNQAVKNTRLTEDYATWRTDMPFAPDWASIEADLRAATGLDITFRDMAEDTAEGLPLGGGLLAACGLEKAAIAALKPAKGTNASLPTGAVDFMLAANRSPLSKQALRKLRRLVEDNRTLFINAALAAPDPTSDAAEQSVPTRHK